MALIFGLFWLTLDNKNAPTMARYGGDPETEKAPIVGAGG